MSTVYIRELVASANLEAPRDLFELASHSRSAGALYVHPDLTWNTETGVWMIALAKVLGRPTVNGYLGVAPAWFGDASRVLHRFPDAEAVWLLRKWKVLNRREHRRRRRSRGRGSREGLRQRHWSGL